jgi:uncharacterized UPF0146 family protein
LNVTKRVTEILKEIPDARVLDYGSGKKPLQAQRLIERGYNVTVWDIGKNFVDGIHDPDALKRKYDLVYASNVLNVQPKPICMEYALKITREVLDPRGYGIFVTNYPDPHYMPELKWREVEMILKYLYPVVKKKSGIFCGLVQSMNHLQGKLRELRTRQYV